MATFREMVYMTLDILKERSDDSFYTEEHILFLLSKMRALIIQRKIKGSRNQAFEALSDDNMQQICLTLAESHVFGTAKDVDNTQLLVVMQKLLQDYNTLQNIKKKRT